MLAAIIAVINALGKLLGLGELISQGVHDGSERRAGAAEQKAVDQTTEITEIKEARDAESHVDAAGDAELERLRDKWTRD